MNKKTFFVLGVIFILGILLGWSFEMCGFWNDGLGSPNMESLFTKLWPFRYWIYLW